MTNPRVFLELTAADNVKLGKLTIELRKDIVPRTAENFRQLCTGQPGFGYKNCTFYRVASNFAAVSGDVEQNNGKGGKSIYGKAFEDENFNLSHNERGVVSMESSGKANNVNSRFYILFAKATYLDKKDVVVGKVIDGLGTLQKLEECGSPDGKPTKTVTISDCGVA
ncbi:peptidyl-prolyl cis-trans isomerase [Rhipicephalus sanguineus]|uniref:Peptidyl-prolyl cis-trans isomerase n=1 Tax=Rhipicephalus sanguineus TaxID=34632 RepID=A0A9D4PRX4_RHISA|nr:peptidyl-prolyl cis-trans isomerase [Rhipicephalus sanguineus]KAH7951917.1 hypothetical protein HPB52_015405 [Rhipicephalus sanguineus]